MVNSNGTFSDEEVARKSYRKPKCERIELELEIFCHQRGEALVNEDRLPNQVEECSRV